MGKNDVESSQLIKSDIEIKYLLVENDKCDKYDYLASVGCGAIAGIIDIFLVGTPGDSKLQTWTDSQVDNAVKGFAKISGWIPKDGQNENISSAIGFIERKYKVNYDQRYSSDVGNLFEMSTKNHHIMSLAHSPDIIGLFFSILNQFNSTSSFISDGNIITVDTETFQLKGSNFITKIFCGIANWFGHIMSDIAGSSGGRGNGGRGTGVVMPFYELFQFCKFGSFNVGNEKKDLAAVAINAFERGYDFRFGLAMAIPVIITDLSIKLVWSIRRYFQYKKPIKECIPTSKHVDLRVMLLFGNGTLCIMDSIDAGLRSHGDFLAFFMRLNLIAWFRFVTLVLKEVCIRSGMSNSLHANIDAFKRINKELQLYLVEIEKIDIELYRNEVEVYRETIEIFLTATTDYELRKMLLDIYEKFGIDKPWEGNFNDHMANKKGTLIFD
ncbi:MAG: hypothetical protein RR657_04395 [Peptostreptococcaceae bacterium]